MKKLIKKLLIMTFLLSLINCKTKTSENDSQTTENNLKRVWMLVEFQNFKKEDLVKHKAQMNLTDLKNPNANMGCNRISYQIEVKQNNIKFFNLRSTKMFCENIMELENAFLKSLDQYNFYNIQGQKLILTNSKNEKIVFVTFRCWCFLHTCRRHW